MTPELKALINWLNTYAFVAWSLMNYGDLGIEHLIEISEKETDEYKALLDEFKNEKRLVLEKAREE